MLASLEAFQAAKARSLLFCSPNWFSVNRPEARRYPAARRLASAETGLPLTTFPLTCPWRTEQVLDADFWSEEESC